MGNMLSFVCFTIYFPSFMIENPRCDWKLENYKSEIVPTLLLPSFQSQMLDCVREIVSSLPVIMTNFGGSTHSVVPPSFHYKESDDVLEEEAFDAEEGSPKTPDDAVCAFNNVSLFNLLFVTITCFLTSADL